MEIIIFKKNFGERDREMKIAPWAYSLISLFIGLSIGLYDGFSVHFSSTVRF